MNLTEKLRDELSSKGKLSIRSKKEKNGDVNFQVTFKNKKYECLFVHENLNIALQTILKELPSVNCYDFK